MIALLVTLSMWVQGMPIKCDKVTRDKDGFYHRDAATRRAGF